VLLAAALGTACATATPAAPGATAASPPTAASAGGGGLVVLASTIGPIEAGIVGALEEKLIEAGFETELDLWAKAGLKPAGAW
jgi:hypothetical protein